MTSPDDLTKTLFDETFDAFIDNKVVMLLESEAFQSVQVPEQGIAELKRLFRSSEFCLSVCLRYPQTVIDLLINNGLQRDYGESDYLDELSALTENCSDEQELARILREYRNQAMLRIAWRDLVRNVDVEVTLRELSWLADACILLGMQKLHNWIADEIGKPLDSEGNEIKLVALAMGKLGAYELNFSSDIDLIFTYKEDGSIKNGTREIAHSQFFVRLCQRFINLLSQNNAYGFVFRVDARLRPFGNSGQLALSFDAMEMYYERHGREWERYAMIKARPISEDPDAANEILSRMKPFVYRRYLDFSAFESLREMKRLIDHEIVKKGAERNVKLGPGGIREVEFIGQAFQLIRGGRTRQLQTRGILQVLTVLQNLNLLPEYVVKALSNSYVFLRKTENAIQAFEDKQTHLLPNQPLEQNRLVYALGFTDWDSLLETLRKHTTTVHEHFEQIFSAPQLDSLGGTGDAGNEAFADLWLGVLDEEASNDLLQHAGYPDFQAATKLIAGLRNSSVYCSMGPNGKQRLDKLIPLIIPVVASAGEPNECLLRVFRLLEAIAKRTAYLALLAENPMGLSQLVKLFDISPWIVDTLVRHPVLLDELLDPRQLYQTMSKEQLQAELEYQIDFSSDDVEHQMNRLIDFKQSNVLRVAASELTGAMPVEKVSDHLTFIAEIVLDAVRRFAMQHLIERHGTPQYELDGEVKNAEFCIIGYGKLGGLELGFGSDLDLVFLHDSQGQKQQTNGEKPIDNAVFFARLGQRIIHFLNTRTQSGVLYEVDTRLRPSGSAGMLVSSAKSFMEYQKNKAWTWEHQALIRARAVAGDDNIRQIFDQIRKDILTYVRGDEKLITDVRDMRVRMRKELDKTNNTQVDLKQGSGGIADIEFIIQYLVLRWANEYPDLVTFSDNLRLIETLVKNGLLNEDDGKILSSAYLAFRHKTHELALQRKKALINNKVDFQDCREGVEQIWNVIMGQ